MKKIIFVLSLVSITAMAKDQSCNGFRNCIDVAADVTDVVYLNSSKLKGSLDTSGPLNLSKDNANEVISSILTGNGYARIHVKDNIYEIVNARDIRYKPLKQIHVDNQNSPKLDFREDYHQMVYQIKTNADISSISRNLRPFVSRYGRIITDLRSKQVIVNDLTRSLVNHYNIIKNADKPLSDKEVRLAKKDREFRQKIRLAEAENCKRD